MRPLSPRASAHTSRDLEAHGQPKNVKIPTDISHTDGVETDVEALDNNGDGPYAKHYRPDARIWRLYLEEAGTEDKELTTIWKSGLDSLLLFAGLFAGVLTAFILQSCQKLEENPQERLLKEILYTIRNDSIAYAPQSFQPTTVVLCINFLWFVSFTLTLISALGGVLAKGWVAKFTPASGTERCQDACDRHLRYIRARQWHLGGIITGLPILIQLALLLFFLGLVLFTHDGQAGIGFTICVLVVFTLLLYVASTILPFFSPAGPLHTPISDLISPMAEKDRTHRRLHDAQIISRWQEIVLFFKDVQVKPTQIQIKADILAWIFANSKDDETLKEAVKAMAGTTRNSTQALRDAFQKDGADEYLHQRFVNCFESTPGDVCLREAYLYALLRLVQPTDTPYGNSQFADLLKPKQPLYRWDGDSEQYLWALAFSVRTHIRANQNKDDDGNYESWEQTRKNLVSMAEAGSTPYVRKILVEAAVRGLTGRKMNLKRTCGLVLSKRLNNANVREIMRTLQATHSKGKESTTVQVNSDVLKNVLRNFIVLLKDDDHVIRTSVSQGLITLADHLEFHGAIAAGIPMIVTQLESEKLQSDAVDTLSKLAGRVEFRDAVTANILTLLARIESPDCAWRIQAVAVYTLSILADHVEFRDTISPCIPMLVKLLNSYYCQYAAANALSKLAEHVEFRATISESLPTLLKLLKSSNVRDVVLDTLSNLAQHTDCRLIIADMIPTIVTLVECHHWDFANAAARTLSKLAEHAECRLPISDNIFKLVNLLESPYSDVRDAAEKALIDLAERAFNSLHEQHFKARSRDTTVKLHHAISDHIPTLVTLLESSNWKVQTAAARTLSGLANHAELHAAISPSIPTLVKLLDNDSSNSDVRWLASEALSNLAGHNSQATIIGCIPIFLKLLKFHGSVVQDAAARALSKLAKDANSCNTIATAIPMLLRLLEDSSPQQIVWSIANRTIHVKDTAVLALLALADHVDARAKIVAGIPKLLTILKTTHSDVQARALSKLAEHVELRDAISPCIPKLVKWLESPSWQGLQVVAADALSKLTDHAEFRPTIANNIPTLAKLLGSTDSNIQAAAAKILRKIGGVDEFAIDKSVALVRLEIGDALGQCLDMGTTVSDQPSLSTDRKIVERGLILPVSHRRKVSTALTLLQNNPINTATHSLKCLCTFTRGIFHIMGSLFPPVMSLVSLLESPDQELQDAASNALLKLAGHADSRITVASSIPKLVELLESSDLTVRNVTSRTLSKLVDHVKLRTAIAAEIPTLVTLLESTNGGVQVAVSDILPTLAEHVELRPTISPAIPTLAKLLESTDTRVRCAASETLSKLADHAELRTTISLGIPTFVMWLETTNPNDLFAACILLKLADEAESCPAIPHCVAMLVTLLESRRHKQLDIVAVDALSKVAMQTKFCPEIAASILTLMTLLKSNKVSSRAQVAATDSLSKLACHAESRLEIAAGIPSLFTQLDSSDGGVQAAVMVALSKLADQAELCTVIASEVSSIVRLLDSPTSEVRVAASDTLSKLVMHAELYPAIAACIPTLVTLLNSTYWEAQVTAGDALSTLADHVQRCATVNALICTLLKSLHPTILKIQDTRIVLTLSKHVELRKAISPDIPGLLELMESNYSHVRTVAALALSDLADHVEFHAAISPCIPILVNSLDDSNWRFQVSTSQILSKLASHAKYRPKISRCIPRLVTLLQSPHWQVQDAAGRTLSKFANHAELRTVVNANLPALVKLLDSHDIAVQVASGCALSGLADHTEFHPAIACRIPTLVKLLGSYRGDDSARATDALLQLAEHNDFLPVIDSSVSQLLHSGLSHYDDNSVRSSVNAFCHLYLHGHLQDMLLQVILLALTSLKAQDHDLQRSGVTILGGLAEHSIFIPSIHSVTVIIEFFEHYMQDVPRNVVKDLLDQMVSFGYLEGF